MQSPFFVPEMVQLNEPALNTTLFVLRYEYSFLVAHLNSYHDTTKGNHSVSIRRTEKIAVLQSKNMCGCWKKLHACTQSASLAVIVKMQFLIFSSVILPTLTSGNSTTYIKLLDCAFVQCTNHTKFKYTL